MLSSYQDWKPQMPQLGQVPGMDRGGLCCTSGCMKYAEILWCSVLGTDFSSPFNVSLDNLTAFRFSLPALFAPACTWPCQRLFIESNCHILFTCNPLPLLLQPLTHAAAHSLLGIGS